MKLDFGELYFTEYDEKITGLSKRDPLGLQPIWSYYGRRVIKHLTTVSGDIRGFREVLLCLSVCASVKEKRSDANYQHLILMFEQLFIYSAIAKGDREGIIGADNGNTRYFNSKKNPVINVENPILVREISLGYYGRYKTPLTTMGVIDKNSFVCTDINVQELYGKDNYDKILYEFDKFVASSNCRTLKTFGAIKQIYEAVAGELRPNEIQFWLEKLQIRGTNQYYLMSECYKRADMQKSYKEVLDTLISEREIYDIENLEPFLRCLESVFYQALLARNINDISLPQDILDKHIQRYRNFLTISDTKDGNSEMLSKRMKYIREFCNPEASDYVFNVLNYHKYISAQKHSAVWIEADRSTGNVQVFVSSDISDVDIDKWGRDYYLSSLFSIKQRLTGASNNGK